MHPFIKILSGLVLFTACTVCGQQISGNYQGIITQSEGHGALSKTYAYWLEIRQNAGKVEGKTRIAGWQQAGIPR